MELVLEVRTIEKIRSAKNGKEYVLASCVEALPATCGQVFKAFLRDGDVVRPGERWCFEVNKLEGKEAIMLSGHWKENQVAGKK